ncbi:MAG: hypothetical protein AVDCRST_MAG88-3470, partial [uncultured Thermomicrobiales bacterium]
APGDWSRDSGARRGRAPLVRAAGGDPPPARLVAGARGRGAGHLRHPPRLLPNAPRAFRRPGGGHPRRGAGDCRLQWAAQNALPPRVLRGRRPPLRPHPGRLPNPGPGHRRPERERPDPAGARPAPARGAPPLPRRIRGGGVLPRRRRLPEALRAWLRRVRRPAFPRAARRRAPGHRRRLPQAAAADRRAECRHEPRHRQLVPRPLRAAGQLARPDRATRALHQLLGGEELRTGRGPGRRPRLCLEHRSRRRRPRLPRGGDDPVARRLPRLGLPRGRQRRPRPLGAALPRLHALDPRRVDPGDGGTARHSHHRV